jgi:major membrane immunogen (membrane-anchored lipoprotein)
MKKKIFLASSILLSAICICSYLKIFGQQKIQLLSYKDGKYEGVSKAVYVSEPFFGKAFIRIEKGKIKEVSFTIRDSANHETFDGNYEKHYTGNALYIDQCRNDWKGVQSYPDSLLNKQDIEKVDAVSGATWSYNIFKASVKEALKKAKK